MRIYRKNILIRFEMTVLRILTVAQQEEQENNNDKTRKLSYRKDDRAMRPIYGCMPWKFSRVSEYAHGYFSRNF